MNVILEPALAAYFPLRRVELLVGPTADEFDAPAGESY
jgi:hypothetical protein